MASKAEQARRPILQAGNTEESDGEDGFTLLEMVCVLAIIALIAAIILPSIPHGTSRSRLESYAFEIASLLNTDRSAAIRQHTEVDADVDAAGRSIRSGATGRVIHVPDDVVFDAALAARCNERPAGSSIEFFPSGMSCGGVIAMTRLHVIYQVRVNWLTGGVKIVRIDAH
jgi:general secretion pathway protein H